MEKLIDISQDLGKTIMGENFFGIEDAVNYFSITPPEQELLFLEKIPFTEEVLKTCKDTHILTAVFPLSIIDIYSRVDPKLFYKHKDDKKLSYIDRLFAKTKNKLGWHLVRKTPVSNSFKKTWLEQQKSISFDEEIPEIQIMVYVMIGHFLKTGERLLTSVSVRCLNSEVPNYHIFVDNFVHTEKCLYINMYWDSDTLEKLGISSMKKRLV